jgi:hypothetical protein
MALSAKKPLKNISTLKVEALNELVKEKTIKLNVNVPESLHSDFKMECIKNKETMSEVVKRYIEKYIS